MTSITDAYGITGTVPFEDLQIEKDNLQFLDPRVVRLQSPHCRYSAYAHFLIESFFDEVVRCVLSPSPGMKSRGRQLLSSFEEPRETRLGYAKQGIDGHGAGSVIGGRIWAELSTRLYPLVRVGILKQIEALPIYIPDVAKDLTSDIVTRICYEALCRFTQDMVARYPQFTQRGDGVRVVSCQVWDPQILEWVEEEFHLPVWTGKPLVLIPKRWSNKHLLMSAQRYHGKAVLDFVQEKETRITDRGELLAPTKKALVCNSAYKANKQNIVQITKQATNEGVNLYNNFCKWVDGKYAG